jgi:metal-responsive CopG/Arc/MetJ family transcriptional regulator
MARKTTIVAISLPNDLLQEVEAVRAEEYFTRSELITAGVRLYLRARAHARQEIDQRVEVFTNIYDHRDISDSDTGTL